MTEENDVDLWQNVEVDRRASNPARPQHTPRTRAIHIHRIRNQIARRRLQEKCRMANERQDDIRCRGWRVYDWLFDVCRPSGPSREQQARHSHKWLQRRARWIEEPAPVEVIARAH
jgi:hypothetical protein